MISNLKSQDFEWFADLVEKGVGEIEEGKRLLRVVQQRISDERRLMVMAGE